MNPKVNIRDQKGIKPNSFPKLWICGLKISVYSNYLCYYLGTNNFVR